MKIRKTERQKIKGRILCFMTIMAIVVGLYQPVAAAESQIIRVGFFAFDGYHNLDEDGCRSGYGYDFIQKILRYSNATAEYVGYDKSWSQMQEMLEDGEIDILTSAQKTPEREEKFDFSEPIGTSAAILTVKAGNDNYVAGEYPTYQNMRVGVIEGNSRNDRFEEYAKEKGFSYSLVYYDSIDTMTEDLQTGNKIDAIVTSNLRKLDNEWILDKFATSSFYAMVKKGNTELLDEVNYAINQMNSNDVGWQDELFDKYYAGTDAETISLSSTEREFLYELKDQERKIKVLANPDRAPYSYMKAGKLQGILPDIFEEVAERLGLTYEYMLCTTRDEYQNCLSNGDADVVIDIRNDLSAAEDVGYKVTDTYLDLAYTALERTDFSGEVTSVATLKDADASESNLNYFTDRKEVSYYDTMEECVNAVIKKEVDVCYLFDYCGQKYAAENIRGVLQATTLPDISDGFSFGVRATDDYRLLTVLNKGARSVRQNYADTAVKRNTDFSIGKLTMTQLLWRNPTILIVIIALLSALVILLVYGFQRKKNERVEQEKNRELERFIGYVCKAYSSVMEVNFKTGKAKEYELKNGHIEMLDSDFKYTDKELLHEEMSDDDFSNITSSVNANTIDEMIEHGEDRYFEYRMKVPGGYHWYAVTMTAIPRDEEHPRNVILFQRDIDELKKKEEETKQSLKDALEAANQASASKGSFLSNMSHEIRTPLNAIIGYLTLAKDRDVTPDKLKHCIDNCDVASRHLLQIINDILDMSSIETGKLKIAHEEFDLKKEIMDITTIFFQNAKSKGVEFETRIDNLTEEWVIGDQLRLNQILMNLLSNAVKFTPDKGNVKLTIQQINEDEKKVFLQFIVSDTGIGMSEEYMSRIFKPFEQENAGTAKKFGGSGLGLSITNNLIKMMGGTIIVQSKQNEGTTFKVTLYFDKSQMSHEKKSHVDYSHVRVLVVDDKEDECTYVKEMLKRCGVRADFVTSGEAALKRVKSRMGGDYPYDLCIIDWNMPGMNGCEVTRSMRQELGAKLPIIIATAYDITEFSDEAKEAGADRIVAKPLFQSTLFDILVSTFGEYDPEAVADADKKRIDMSGVRVLLAEDNPMNMDIAVTILEKSGIRVDQASNGEEAYQCFLSAEKGTYDLILMDVQMPVMDGYEATRKIRNSNHPEAKSIPIIAMTANAFAEDVAEALSNGMDAHIAKPINYDKLFELLQKYS